MRLLKSWAVVSTLIRRNESAFFAFIGDIAKGTNVPAALQTHYGMGLSQLEGALRGCGRPASMTAQDQVHVTMAGASVARAELLEELGKLLASVRGREHEAERHFAATSSVPALR